MTAERMSASPRLWTAACRQRSARTPASSAAWRGRVAAGDRARRLPVEGRHRGGGGSALRAAVLGANDGLVSNLSLLTGLVGLLAGAISMALDEWLSVHSSRELYGHQLEIEGAEPREFPGEERDELALIYQSKG